jgi:hypothetical protein
MASVVSAAKGTFLARSLESGNALLNSEYDNDNYIPYIGELGYE